MLAAVAFFCSLGEEVSDVGYIYRKLDSEDYLISNRVVDCPTAIKLKLYEYIRFEEELYIKYVPQKQEVQFFKEQNKDWRDTHPYFSDGDKLTKLLYVRLFIRKKGT